MLQLDRLVLWPRDVYGGEQSRANVLHLCVRSHGGLERWDALLGGQQVRTRRCQRVRAHLPVSANT
jgi:hypothetical protein